METEIKLKVEDAEEAARGLEAIGAVLRVARTFEDNRLYDLPDRSLLRGGRLLRVRQTDGGTVVTAKAPAESPGDSRYKVRREAEMRLESAAEVVSVLETAGFEPLWRYQKYRRTYDCEGAEVVVDETPAGSFLEIEGEPDAIERVVARLGAKAGPRFTGTYRDVWEAACRERGVELGDMLFEGAEGR